MLLLGGPQRWQATCALRYLPPPVVCHSKVPPLCPPPLPDTQHDVLLASEVVEQLLSQLPAGEQRQARALRLRFRLEGAPAAAEGEGELLDYASVGRQLGVGRQRAQQLVSAGLARARQVATAAGLL